MECNICYIKYPILQFCKVCENNHVCCNNCILKIDKCHLCRSDILDITSLKYSNIYSKTIIFNNINIINIINTIYNNNKDNVRLLFNNELPFIASCKIPTDYEIYYLTEEKEEKEVKEEEDEITIYKLSKCYVNLDDVYKEIERYNIKTNIVRIVVPSDKIFIDLNYLTNKILNYVILFKGTYKCDILKRIKKYKSNYEYVLSDFTYKNMKILLNSRYKHNPYFYTKEELENIYSELNICKIYTSLSKSDIIHYLIKYNIKI